MLLLLQMFPLVLIMIPLYNIFLNLRLVGTLTSLIVANGTFSMPFAIWLLVGFFDVMPREIEESGTIDGCNRWQIFYNLVVPLASPCIASAGIFTFINSWNEYMMANILIKSDLVKTLPVGLATFIQQFGAEWGSLMAAATMTLLPVVFFLVFTQKYIVQGLTAGAVKG
jgi:ABC-type glycerol-3-phosphate transport system permease component